MALTFRSVDRDQQFLLPPSMADWLADDHVVWFLIAVVEGLDMSKFQGRAKLGGAGREPIDPRLLLLVLIYGYCLGERSSRQLERQCRENVAFRVITANEAPDHTTISRFRKDNESAFASLFEQVLELCAAAGLGQLGVVALDGTKIAANASKDSNTSASRLREEVDRIMREADEADNSDDDRLGDDRGDSVPPRLRDPSHREERIAAAWKHIQEQREQASAAASANVDQGKVDEYLERMADPSPGARAAGNGFTKPPRGTDRVAVAEFTYQRQRSLQQARIDDREFRKAQCAAQGTVLMGVDPLPVDQARHVARAKEHLERVKVQAQHAATETTDQLKPQRANTTDPQSRLMKTRGGWIQGYNCQIVATADQIILAAHATQDHGDVAQYEPMIDAAQRAARHFGDGRIDTVVADAGYHSKSNLTAEGPERLIPDGKGYATAKAAIEQPSHGPPPAHATPAEAMKHRLRTAEGIDTYSKRKTIIEPINGHLKDRTGLRQFSRRGLEAADSELKLCAAVLNLGKLFRATPA